MAIELFIFDWSGTISDDRRPVYESNMRLFQSHGIPKISFEEWSSISAQNASELLSSKGINKNYSLLIELYEKYYDNEIKKGNIPKIYPEVVDTLELLIKNKKDLAILSSHPQQFLLEEAKQYGIKNKFFMINGGIRDKIIGLETIYKMLDHRANETAYIGDTIYDIHSAKALKLNSIAVCGGYHSKKMLKKENPDHLLDKISDLKNII